MSEEKAEAIVHPEDDQDLPKQPGKIIQANEAKLHARPKSRKGVGSFLAKHKKIVLAVAIIVIALLGYSIYKVNHKPVTTYTVTKATNVCTTGSNIQLLKQAAPLFTQPKYLELKKVVDKIQKLPGYQQDPNCLYVVVTYEVNAADASNASNNFNKLVQVYNPNKGFSTSLGNGVSLQGLQTSVNNIKKVIEQSKTNASTFGNP